ncbi:hypothetical protein X798_07723 [Onchocerca flexuosa]|uniref:SEA domain-containing protein n=2 Tax=Onchocerca flexuosa TaxID=387005 RepID=A0A183I2N1_9BILA|nr:hypothetical protein X798_07723 [Onchocerca flexuosa]VDP15201.1 unnamed protein product [Onchocerca flexuosa]
MSNRAGMSNEINVSQLVSDVSRTLNGFKNLFTSSPKASGVEVAAQYDTPPLSNIATDIFSGNVCFKACGMEDIQLAAQQAAELFITLRYCIITLTIFVIICMILLSVALGWYLIKTTLVFDERSGLPIGTAFSGTSVFSRNHYQKTQSLNPTEENLKK